MQWMLYNLQHGQRAPARISYETTVNDISDVATYTYASTDIGTAADDRYVICGITADGPTEILAVTIGGILAARAILSPTAGNNNVGIFFARVPTGSTATIVVTMPAGSARGICAVWAAYGLVNPVVYGAASSTADPAALSMNVKAGGVGVGIAYNEAETASHTWTGLTEDFETGNIDGVEASGASAAFSATEAPRTVQDDYSAITDVTAAAACFANSEPAQAHFCGYAFSNGTTIDVPAGVQAGDVLILHDVAVNNVGTPSSVTPSEFTPIADTGTGTIRAQISYKYAEGDEGGTSLTGMNGNIADCKTLAVFRKTVRAASLTTGSAAGEATTGNPTLQTVAASGEGETVLVIGGAGCAGTSVAAFSTFTGTPSRSWSNTNTVAFAGSQRFQISVYDSAPENVDIDMNDLGTNVLQSAWLKIT